MELNESYLRTIEKVKASLVFSGFSCAPEEISERLGIEPDRLLRQGEEQTLPNGVARVVRESQWALDSRSDSKDVNVQMREILDRIIGLETKIEPAWNPFFNILWRGNYLYAGSGPNYERDVLRRVAAIRAEIWQDIYQVDLDDPS